MNRPVIETLDETIDRVAAAITAVPADPGFSSRLAPRLERPARGVSMWMVGAAAAAAIVLAAWLVRPEPSTIGSPQQANATQPAAPATGPAPSGSTAAAPAPAMIARAPRLAPAAAEETTGAPIAPASAIAALDPIETLTVDDLTLHQIQIAPVDIAHLDIETLDVPQIDTTDEPKE